MTPPLKQVQTASQRGGGGVGADGDEDRAAHGGGALPGGPETGGLVTSAGGAETPAGPTVCPCLAVPGRGRADRLPL